LGFAGIVEGLASMARGDAMNGATNDTPPVMVAIGADLIREAVNLLYIGASNARDELAAFSSIRKIYSRRDRIASDSIESEIARMEATAKALAEALPGERV
jgi:hypothetical protein